MGVVVPRGSDRLRDMATAPSTFTAIIPPLESGDRLTRHEFHRRYEASPRVKKAELVEGVVYVASPVRAKYHGIPEADLGAWLSLYRVTHATVSVAHNSTVFLDNDNELQPDLCAWYEVGQARLDDDGYIEGAPDLVAEIAASSSSFDLHQKKNAYRRNGVREYIVWRVLDSALDWFVLEGGDYRQVEPGDDGCIQSSIFPGLRLNVAALLSGDLAAVLATQQGPR